MFRSPSEPNQAQAYGGTAVLAELVIFTVRRRTLLIQLTPSVAEATRVSWELPGRLLQDGLDLDLCARRVLVDDVGLSQAYLEQLYTFSRCRQALGPRFVSVAYFAIVPEHLHRTDGTGPTPHWFPMGRRPAISADHEQILLLAHKRLQDKLKYTTLAFQFLAEQFTLGELQAVYETILNEELDKRNFRKRMRASGCLEETGRLVRSCAHRPARLYRPSALGQVVTFG